MNPDELVAYGRARFDHAAAKRLIKEKYQAKLIFAHNGGMWESTPTMISFLGLWGDQQIVLKDLYDNPIKIHASLLLEQMKTRYQEQMNAWLVEYENLVNNK